MIRQSLNFNWGWVLLMLLAGWVTAGVTRNLIKVVGDWYDHWKLKRAIKRLVDASNNLKRELEGKK